MRKHTEYVKFPFSCPYRKQFVPEHGGDFHVVVCGLSKYQKICIPKEIKGESYEDECGFTHASLRYDFPDDCPLERVEE